MKRFLSLSAWAATAIVLVVGGALLIVEFDGMLAARMTELKEQTISELERLVGRRISYQSISPSILQYIEIRNLSVYDSTDAQRILLTVNRMRISYSLFHLITNRDAVGSLREIRIENSAFHVDTNRDGDIVSLLEEVFSAQGEERLKVKISGANVGLDITRGADEFSLSNLFFSIDSRSDSLEVSVRGAANGSIGKDFQFRSVLSVQGKVGKKFDWSDVTLRIVSFTSSLVTLESQNFQLVWKGKNLEVRKLWDHSPIDVQFLADLERRVFTVNFQTEGFHADRLVRFAGWLRRYSGWLSAPITASGTVTYDQPSGSLDYRAVASAYFANQLPISEAEVTASLHGSEKMACFAPLSIRSPTGSAEFTGDILFEDFMPEGLLSMSDVWVEGGKVNAELSLVRLEGSLEVRGERFQIGEISFSSISLSLAPDRAGERFSLLTSFADSPPNSLKADGVINIGKDPRLTAAIKVDHGPPEKLMRLILGGKEPSAFTRETESILSNFDLSAQVTLDTDFTEYSIYAQPLSLASLTDPDTRLSLTLALDRQTLSLSVLTGVIGGNEVKGEFNGGFVREGALMFSTNVSIRGVPFDLAGVYDPVTGLEIDGSYNLRLSLLPTYDGFTLQAKSDSIPLPFDGGPRRISFTLQGSFPMEGQWEVIIPSLSLYDIPLLESKNNATEMSAYLVPATLTVSRLRFTDSISTLEGIASVEYATGTDLFDPRLLSELAAQISLQLSGKGSSERYALDGELRDGILDVKTDFEAVPLARIGTFALTGELSGSAAFKGQVQKPVADVSVSLKNGRLGTDPIALSTRLTLSGDDLDVMDLRLDYLSHRLRDSTGTLHLSDESFSLNTRYRGNYFGDYVETNARLEGAIHAHDLESLTSDLLNQRLTGGKLALSSVTVNGKSFPSWDIDIDTGGGILTLDGGPQDSIHGTLNSKGQFALLLKSPLPVTGKAEGSLSGGQIEAVLSVDNVDLQVLNPILKSPVIFITSGVATGTVTVVGPMNDPDFTGHLQVIGGGITCVYAVDVAGPISTDFSFSGKSFSFPTVAATAGKGRVSASGSFTLDHWIPVSFDVNLATANQSLVHLQGKFGSVRVDGYASGEIRVWGNEARTDVKGAMVASDCAISLGPYPTGKFVPENPPTFLALNVTTGMRDEFRWPSPDLPVVRTIAKPGSDLAITYRGDTGAYTVKGSAEILGGEVYYFDRSFVLRNGNISFDESQAEFDPHITVRAETREWDVTTGDEVKVFLEADNRLSQFFPHFSSDPPRTEIDILAMIGAPIVARAYDQGVPLAAIILGTDPFFMSVIMRPFEQKVRELLGVDTFSLRSQLIQNLLAQKLLGSGIGMVNPLDNTSVSLGKYIGTDLYMEMMLRLQAPPADPAIVGFMPGIKTDLEISLEWTTPFFLLEWTFTPKTWQSLFIPDNTISLNWSFSF